MSLLRELEAIAATNPDKDAVTFYPQGPSGPRIALSYESLVGSIKRNCGALESLGVSSDDVVGVVPLLTPQALIAIIAAASVAKCHPINPLLSTEAIEQQLSVLQAHTILTESALGLPDKLKPLPDGFNICVFEDAVADVRFDAWNARVSASSADFATPERQAGDVCLIFATGGTTGAPKLAQLSNENVLHAAQIYGDSVGARTSDRTLSGLPLFHVGGLIDAALTILLRGGTIIFPSPLGMRDPTVMANIWRLVEGDAATLLAMVPTSLSALAGVERAGEDIGSLRAISTGSSPLSRAVADALEEQAGVPIVELYGMTESSGIISTNSVTDRVLGTVGRPCEGVEVAIVDPAAPAPAGQVGEIFVRGRNVFSGYLNDAQNTGVFRDGGWFATGDLGTFDGDGRLVVTGRSKDLIIRGGHNIDPIAIEEVALSHPAVLHAGAVGLADDYADEVPVLFVMLKPRADADNAEIADFVAERIHEGPARPKHLAILEQIPLTPMGKVFKPTLRTQAVQLFAEGGQAP